MIIITARPYRINWSGNGIWYEITRQPPIIDDGVYFEARVQIKRTYEDVYTPTEAYPLIPSNGKATFNIQSIVDAELEFGLPQLVDDLSVIAIANQTAKFYIEFREIAPDSADVAWQTSESEFECIAVKGGVPEFLFNNNGYWQNYFPSKKPFLTWQLNGRLAAYNERMYLAWLSPSQLQDVPMIGNPFYYKVSLLFSDLTTNEKNFPFTVNPNIVYFLPVGGAMLNLNSIEPAKRIYKWNVQVWDNSNPAAPVAVSEKFFYEMDNRPDYNDMQLLYRNSAGGLDSVRVRGIIENTLDYTLQQTGSIRKPYYQDADRVSASLYQLPAQELIQYKGDIGYVKKEEQDRFRDLFLQRELYFVKNKRWWPVKLNNKKF